MNHTTRCTAFNGPIRLASGPLHNVVLAVKRAAAHNATGPLLIYNDDDARVIDVDLRGSDAETVARLPQPEAEEPRGRGRPKLGVTAREVTLLPRHWNWLATQPGGASVALRKLVEDARRASGGKDRLRHAQEAAYRFMSAMAGDLPGFEEATRALFANDRARFDECIASWPGDVREYTEKLAFAERETAA
jgi:hypothetical protein